MTSDANRVQKSTDDLSAASRLDEALDYADSYFERGMVGKSIAGGDAAQTLAGAVRGFEMALRAIMEVPSEHTLLLNAEARAMYEIARRAIEEVAA